MKKKTKLIIVALSIFVSTSARAEMEIEDVEVVKTCTGEPLVLASAKEWNVPSLCNCNGYLFTTDQVPSDMRCTPWGLYPQYPMPVEFEYLCPDRVNRYFDPGDGKCGSQTFNSVKWLLQNYFGVDFPVWGCIDHDSCYGDCSVKDRSVCD